MGASNVYIGWTPIRRSPGPRPCCGNCGTTAASPSGSSPDEAGVNPALVNRVERGRDARLSTWAKLFEGLGYRFAATELCEEAADLLGQGCGGGPGAGRRSGGRIIA